MPPLWGIKSERMCTDCNSFDLKMFIYITTKIATKVLWSKAISRLHIRHLKIQWHCSKKFSTFHQKTLSTLKLETLSSWANLANLVEKLSSWAETCNFAKHPLLLKSWFFTWFQGKNLKKRCRLTDNFK